MVMAASTGNGGPVKGHYHLGPKAASTLPGCVRKGTHGHNMEWGKLSHGRSEGNTDVVVVCSVMKKYRSSWGGANPAILGHVPLDLELGLGDVGIPLGGEGDLNQWFWDGFFGEN